MPNTPPSPQAILTAYLVLGGLLAFAFGREATCELPPNLVQEMAPTLVVICGFLVSYSAWDALAVGTAKSQASEYYLDKPYNALPTRVPEAVHLALRVQTNQLEQMTGFLVGAVGCALLVNGKVAGLLALIWAVLRRVYASVYRSSVGIPLKDMGLTRFTIPAYFISNAMLVATAIQALRCYLS